ncbi:MAG: SGNH/GDSL hydrolase family protein, partial [Planctomycetota bacterium]
MTRIRKGAYTLWGLLGLTPALAILTGHATAAAVSLAVWASGFWAIRVALSRVDGVSPLMAYVRSPATGVAAVVTLLLAQVAAVLGSGLAAMTVVMLAAVALVILVATSSSSRVYGQRLGRIMLTVGSLAVFLFGLEATLWAIEASRPPNDRDVTWGRAVHWNEAGFRERDFQTPKPPDTYRVVVLGDSITWGVGLSEDERYTRLAEQQLRDRFSHRRIEILNFGLRGIPTVMQRDMLMHLADLVQPDCVVVGFCFNDPQPRMQSYAVEMDRYQPLFAALNVLRSCGLR